MPEQADINAERMNAERMSIEAERAEDTDHGSFALRIAEVMKDDPTGLLRGRMLELYNTVSATGFVVESDLDGQRYEVRVQKALR